MAEIQTTPTNQTKANPIAKSLASLLGDSYALLGQTHLAHWNVEGPSFFSLHNAFQEQYEELFTAVDEIAERIRSLGDYAPGGLKTLASLSTVTELPVEKIPAKDYVAHLVECNETVVASAKATRDLAASSNDPETEDMMIARIQIHEKTLWMLRSFLQNL